VRLVLFNDLNGFSFVCAMIFCFNVSLISPHLVNDFSHLGNGGKVANGREYLRYIVKVCSMYALTCLSFDSSLRILTFGFEFYDHSNDYDR